MKRLFYVSRFARPLTKQDIDRIHRSAIRFNHRNGITGILMCLGDTFFQVLEGKPAVVDALYNGRILLDSRHRNVFCLKSETGVRRRMFPEWDMHVFNLNEETEVLPMAFRQILTALLESSHTITQYTQPSIFKMLQQGVNPTLVKPRRKRVTVLFSDIVGFSRFAERLKPADPIDLVNSHAEVCTRKIDTYGGEVNKLLGDGVLAYFSERDSDTAIRASVEILQEMQRRRTRSKRTSPHKFLFGGVGLANGMVYEGTIGPALKRDFTILGNTVNLASRLESFTRELNVRLTIDPSARNRARVDWPFRSLGRHKLKGQSNAVEIFSLASLKSLDVRRLYDRIETFLRAG
jgi:class 3 adenylate cyclase